MMQPRAILFDLDGTLLDTIEDLADAMNLVLAGLNAQPHAVKAYKTFIGDGIELLVSRALPLSLREDAMIQRCVVELRQIYTQLMQAKTRPFPQIPELLDTLTARGIALAILSNKPHHPTIELAEKLLSKWPFEAVVGARPEVPRKPSPVAALQIAAQLAVPPNQWLFVGDSGTDMQTARASAMIPVGALWGYRPAEELQAGGAEHLIARPADLLALL